MKTLKALIIEDNETNSYEIASCVVAIALSLKLKVEFVYVREYELAREKVMSMDYDVISLDGVLGNKPSLNLISTILNLHPKAITFFLSSSKELVAKAKKLGIQLSFLKGSKQIINQKDLMEIKKYFDDKELTTHQVLYQELTEALLIFSEPRTDLELFNNSEPKYLQIIKILHDNSLRFALIDRDIKTKIFVDGQSSQLVKEIAEISCLEFWLKWSNEFCH
jgi:hypothetical protein